MRYEAIIESAAKEQRVDPALIRAIITVESNWNPRAFNPEPTIKDSAYGLMQILLGTAQSVSGNAKLTKEQLYDPTVNVMIGTKYLRQLMNRYPTSVKDVIASYNAGRVVLSISPLKRYVNQGYVDKVMSVYGTPMMSYVGPILALTLVGAVFVTSRR